MISRHRVAWHNLAWGITILMVFGALAVLTTWPLVANLDTHLLGQSDDTPLHYWNCWWVKQALTSGQLPWQTPLLFYPQGVSLLTHNIPWFNALLFTILEPFLGGYAAYNTALLIVLALCGISAWILLTQLTGSRWAALIGGIIYQAWPYRLSQLGHPNLMSTPFIPLFMLFLLHLLTKPQGRRLWADAVWAGLSFALIGYTRWQQLIGAVLVGSVLVAFTWRDDWRRRARHLLLAALVAALLLSPPAWLLYAQQSNQDGAAELVKGDEAYRKQTDLLAYVTPAGTHWALSGVTEPVYERYYADRGGGPTPAYVGFTVLLLTLLGVRRLRWRSLPWLIMGALLMILALGPVLRFNGRLYPGIPMPYRWAMPLGFIGLIREPDRFNIFLALPIATLATYGIRDLWQRARWTNNTSQVLSGLAIVALVLVEYLAIPIPLRYVAKHSAFFDQIRAEEGAFAILNLPLDDLQAKNYMFDQTIHGHPIVQGNLSRFPTDVYRYIDGHPWLRGLRATDEMPPELPDISQQLHQLADDGIRYLVLHKDIADADRIAHWRRSLAIDPLFEDEDLIVYRTTPRAGRDLHIQTELGPGLGPIQAILSSPSAQPGRTVELSVCWGTHRAPEAAYLVTIQLKGAPGELYLSDLFPLVAGWPTASWPANWVAWGYYPVPISIGLSPDTYDLSLVLIAAETGKVVGSEIVGTLQITEEDPLTAALPTEAHATDALYGDAMRLLGYQVAQQADRLDISLYWTCEQRMERSYTVFVHVFDPFSTQPVAQDDSRPRRGAYETTQWWPGEVVDDHFAVSLRNMPKGSFGVAVGVYDAETGERLPLTLADGIQPTDRRLVLDKVVVIN